ncbi:MAG: hypothetical protein KDK41_11845 [Leptospiraceae bacterium]|nr:hypothetical protein [Leptospiraceae bacterium]
MYFFLILGIFAAIGAAVNLKKINEPIESKGKTMSRKSLVILQSVIAVVGLGMFGLMAGEDNYDVSRLIDALEYEVIKSDDNSIEGRKRMTFAIKSSAKTMEDRQHTTAKAALQLQEKHSLDTIYIHLEEDIKTATGGYQYCIVSFAPDGKGNGSNDWEWQSSCADNVTTSLGGCQGPNDDQDCVSNIISKKQVEIIAAWRENREKFIENGSLNEAKLKKFISEKLSIPVNRVTLPLVQRMGFEAAGLFE